MPQSKAARATEPKGASAPIVAVSKLRKVYGDGDGSRAALDGVSLLVQKGEFVVILGQSGSGKSTLLGIVGGLERSYEGSVTLFGKDVASLSDKALARLRSEKIGFVFQAFHLLGHLSVLENVLAPALFDSSAKDQTPRALAVLERLGLQDRSADRPAQLSGGQRQRVAIARALLHEPELLLCDEPTGNLDAETGDRTIRLFRELHASGLTVLAVTHEERLASAATRVIRLKDGRIEEEITDPAQLRDAAAHAEITPSPNETHSKHSAVRDGPTEPSAGAAEPVSAADPEGLS